MELILTMLSMFYLYISANAQAQQTLNIGLLIEDDEYTDVVNSLRLVLPTLTKQILPGNANIELLAESIEGNLTSSPIEKACKLLSNGVLALVGPMWSKSVATIAPLLNQRQIPLVAPMATKPLLEKQRHAFLLRLVATDDAQGGSLAALISYFNWTHLTLVTADSVDGLYCTVAIKTNEAAAKQNWQIAASYSLSTRNASALTTHIRTMLRQILSTGVRVTVMNLPTMLVQSVLAEARSLNMLGDGWAWIVTDAAIDMVLINCLLCIQCKVVVKVSNPSIVDNKDLQDLMGSFFSVENYIHPSLQAINVFTNQITDVAVRQSIDAILVVLYALKTFNIQSGNFPSVASMNCFGSDVWQDGSKFMDHLKQVRNPGINRELRFIATNSPAEFSYNILRMDASGWKTVASYSSNNNNNTELVTQGQFLLPDSNDHMKDFVSPLRGAVLRVVTLQEQPFVMYKKGGPIDLANIRNDEVEGYVMDLLKELSNRLGFTYVLYNSPDNTYGSEKVETQTWSGMAKELVEKRADLAAASFTISLTGELGFDFTLPYLDLGLRFVQTNNDAADDLFRFIKPFSYDIWRDICIAFLLVGLAVGFLEKLSPYGIHGEFVYTYHDMERANSTRVRRKRFLLNQKVAFEVINVPNAIWFSWASLLTQGYEIHPRSASGRILAVGWWLGVVIFVATYTAKLGSFLITDRLSSDLSSINDLANQDVIRWGTVANSAPHSFFCNSVSDDYQKICKNLVLRNSSQQAFETVRASDGQFAFIWDSAVIDYAVEQKPCNLRAVGDLFARIGYGFGLQQNSPFTDIISTEILKLRSQGFMDDLYSKWFISQSQCRSDDNDDANSNTMDSLKYGVTQMIGMFLVVYASLAVSIVVLVIEWMVSICHAVEPHIPGRPKTFSEAYAYRWGRMKRDFLVYYVPDRAKDHLGINEFRTGLQVTLRSEFVKNVRQEWGVEKEIFNCLHETVVPVQTLSKLISVASHDQQQNEPAANVCETKHALSSPGMYGHYVDALSTIC